ncbi:MAG TPA: tetratricopeptide repeat protein, partial [Sphingomonadaceae bacterium]|nr:tetratricopeptide repeat protein [Sphingomonadaceae bacterium]
MRITRTEWIATLLAALLAPPAIGAAQTSTAQNDGERVKMGVDAWRAGNFASALTIWRPLAEAGNPDAQFNVAQAYRLGRGVEADPKVAMDWYLKAARQEHQQAEATYGLMLFQNGDRSGAMPWLQKAADRGDPRALYVIATAQFNGDPLPKDWVGAYARMTRAAASGLPQAQTSLAEMDRYIPAEDRAKGTELAAQMAQDAAAGTVPVTTRPAPAPALIQTTELPPSRPAAAEPVAPAEPALPPAPPVAQAAAPAPVPAPMPAS